MASFILTLHTYNVYLVILAAAVAGIFGLVLFFTKRAVLRPWRIALLVSLAFGLLQGLLGLTMVIMGLKPGGGQGLYYLHYVYGGIVALGIPFTWVSFTAQEKDQRKHMLFYSIAALVMVAAAVRAWMTGYHA